MYIWFYFIVPYLKVSLDPISAFWHSPTFCYFSHKYQIVVYNLFQLSELLSFSELVPQPSTEAAPVCLSTDLLLQRTMLLCLASSSMFPQKHSKLSQALFEALHVLGSLWWLSSHFSDGSACIQFSVSYHFHWVINIVFLKMLRSSNALLYVKLSSLVLWSLT